MKNSCDTFPLIFYRSYSRRKLDGLRETYAEMCDRVVQGLSILGKLTLDETDLINKCLQNKVAFPSGRFLWIGGTPWSNKPSNFYGAYNCTNINIKTIKDLFLCMNLGMQGCGVGSNLEYYNINQLPKITNQLEIEVLDNIGTKEKQNRKESSEISLIQEDDPNNPRGYTNKVQIIVGDSREGWVTSCQAILDFACHQDIKNKKIKLYINLENVRPSGEYLNGFGGTANPLKLPGIYSTLAKITNAAFNRRLTALECCRIIDECALVVVAGNIRRFAGIKQFNNTDSSAINAKKNLWTQNKETKEWTIDPEKAYLKMSNHTITYHFKPCLEVIKQAVKEQYKSGEGAIEFVPEAIARGNIDLIEQGKITKKEFIDKYCDFSLSEWIYKNFPQIDYKEFEHRMQRHGLNPCFAEGTMILTKQGHFPIETLVGKNVEVWDGCKWLAINNFRITGENQPVWNVELHSGQKITATPYHNFILESGEKRQLKDLQPGDKLLTHNQQIEGFIDEPGAYLKGFLLGDGTHDQDKPICKVYNPKIPCIGHLIYSMNELNVEPTLKYIPGGFQSIPAPGVTENNFLQGLTARRRQLINWVTKYRHQGLPKSIFNWTTKAKSEFLTGLFDADGTAQDSPKNGFRYQLTSVNYEMIKDVQLLLITLGIESTLRLTKPGGKKDFGKRGGVCKVQPLYRISISQEFSIKFAKLCNFERLTSFAEKKIKHTIKSNMNKIRDIEFSHISEKVYCCTVPTNNQFSLSIPCIIGNCGEILGCDFLCDLAEVHLNLIPPVNSSEMQKDAFQAATINAASLLHHKFDLDKFDYSRKLDPIIGVSFTGLFDFFVNLFGIKWLQWWQEGRPETPEGINFKQRERYYLTRWKTIVKNTLEEYCAKHNLKVPIRYTTVQPAGTKSLLTGAAPGWHPPKAKRYIRRITFKKDDPIALAALGQGYKVTPSQTDIDEQGQLLTDPFDKRCTEWLVNVPVEVSWANMPGVEEIEISKFSALAQLDFYMQIQKFYTTHNTSGTLEVRKDEIDVVAKKIHDLIQKDEGYVSIAILARFDDNQTYPRLPFEPIDKKTYEQMNYPIQQRKRSGNFKEFLDIHDHAQVALESPAGCDSDRCLS